MGCLYKLKKSNLLKKLIKEIDNPDTYIVIYQEFLDYFKSKNKDDKTEEEITDMFNSYLKGKGLKVIEEVLDEIQSRKKVTDDNFVVLELQQNYQEISKSMMDLQELVLKSVEEIKGIKNQVTMRMKMLNNLTNKRQPKVRSSITID